MRLGRLDLTRYGKFTDFTLDFGSAAADRPDLHLVYGPNEAGKSTAFAAYLDLLFGIETRSSYGFLHPYGTMRIGGRLEVAGGEHEVVRIKRQQATLLSPEGRALDEGLIAGELGGIGRGSYKTMFSLDDASLEDGGEEILASKGDLGQLLFATSAGLAELSQTLETLHDEADRFHKAKKQNTALGELSRRFEDLKTERSRIDTQASAYAQLVSARDKAVAGYEDALQARGAAQARRDEIVRTLAALPRLADLLAAREALRSFAELPVAPATWAADLPGLERQEIEIATRLRGIEAEIAALVAEADAVPVDAEALRFAPDQTALADLRARTVTAGKDLPDRRARRDALDIAIRAALLRLGRPLDSDPEATLIAASTVGTLRGLMAERSGITQRLAQAAEEAGETRGDLADAERDLSAAGGDVAHVAHVVRQNLARLAGAIDALRDSDAEIRLRTARRTLRGRSEALGQALSALRPWAGTHEQLAGLVLPDPREVEDWGSTLRDLAAEADRLTQEAERLAGERDRLRAEVDALGRIAGVVGEGEANAIRAERERAWSEHRARLDGPSAEVFETLLRRDDAVTGARFGQATDIARLKAASLSLASLEVSLQGVSAGADRARGRSDAVQSSVRAALDRVDPPLPPDLSPERLSAWMARRDTALAAAAAVRVLDRDIEDAESDRVSARERLAAGLREAGLEVEPEAGFDALLAAARGAVDRAAVLDGLVAKVEERRRRAEARGKALDAAEAAEADWLARWASAGASCWLGENGAVPTLAAVGEVLEILAGLGAELQKRADLDYRIGAMQADEAAFEARMRPLATAFGLDPLVPPLDLDRIVEQRIRTAERVEAARSLGRDKLEEVLRRRSRAIEDAEGNRARGDVMRRLFGVEGLAEVAGKLRDGERRDAAALAVEAAERDIRAGLRTADLTVAEAALDGLDASLLDAELSIVGTRHEAADAQVQEFHARRLEAVAALDKVGGDGTVARIEEERRTLQLDIEEQARRFIRLRGGVAAAEEALRAYRDRHRSAMLAEASRAFETISRGAYRGLATQPGDKGDVLMAIPASGPTKEALALSKGTRFQLYLALRVAGYHGFATTRRPVPFVADDIMETFDDFRAEEAFRLFAGMAKVGQVIYLTHHRHLIEVARAACPTVRVHRLDGAPSLEFLT